MTAADLGVARLLLDPGPDEARRLLARELDRPEYREPLLQRVQGWLSDLVSAATVGGDGLGRAASVAVLLLLASAAVLVLSRLRRGPVRAGAPAAVFDEVRLRAADHRTAARAAYDEARWDDAVVEAVRALAAGLSDRGVVGGQRGVTVHEVVAAAGARFPGDRAGLTTLGVSFDEVRYGDRHADEPTARAALDLESRVAAATPAATDAAPARVVPR